MKKEINLLFVCLFFVFFLAIDVTASSSTASNKGFNTNNLTFVKDTYVEDFDMISEAGYYYGSYSMWVSNYRYYTLDDDGTYSLYLIFFIESSINSSGNSIKKNYFRNKDLNIYFKLNSNKCSFVDMTSSENDSVTSISKSFGCGFSGGYDFGVTATASASFSVINTQSYSSVTLTTSKNSNTNQTYHEASFKYHFANYTDGAMVSPNVGYVAKRMYLLYQIQGLTSLSKEEYTYSVETEAVIFRDKTWPCRNYTMSRSTIFKGDETTIL